MVDLSNLWGKTPDTRSANKQMLLGGIASSLIYYGNFAAEQVAGYPAELKQQIDPHLPTNGELVAGIVPPVALYAIVKFGHKERLRNIANGSVYFGIPNIIERTVAQAAYAEGVAARPTARLAVPIASRYIPSQSSNQVARSATSTGKYRLTA